MIQENETRPPCSAVNLNKYHQCDNEEQSMLIRAWLERLSELQAELFVYKLMDNFAKRLNVFQNMVYAAQIRTNWCQK